MTRNLHFEPDGTVRAISAVEIKRSLDALLCPFCKSGPFRSPLHHVARVHSYSGDEVREMAEIKPREKVTDPAYSEHMATATRGHLSESEARRGAESNEANQTLVDEYMRMGGDTRARRDLASRIGLSHKALKYRLNRFMRANPDSVKAEMIPDGKIRYYKPASDSELRSVAKAYEEAVRQGMPPGLAISEKFGISTSAASRYVKRCRDEGLLK